MARRKNDKHFSSALAGFVIVVVLAAGAFAYIWISQFGFGLSIAGTRSFAQVQMEQGRIQVPGSPDQVHIVVRSPRYIPCTCESEVFSVSTGESKGFRPFSAEVKVPYQQRKAPGALLPYEAEAEDVCRAWCGDQNARFLCTGHRCGGF